MADGAGGAGGAGDAGGAGGAPTYTLLPPQPGAPAVSDAAFANFYASLDDFAPTIPDGLTEHYLLRCGFAAPDERLVRLISLAAQQFVSDVAAEAADVAVQRRAAGAKERRERGLDAADRKGDKRLVLTAEDLAEALAGRGVRVAKPPYFVGSAPGGGTGGAGGSGAGAAR